MSSSAPLPTVLSQKVSIKVQSGLSFLLPVSLTCGFLTSSWGRRFGPFLSFVVQVWTSDGDGGGAVCSVVMQVGSDRVCVRALMCTCMCVTKKHVETFSRLN